MFWRDKVEEREAVGRAGKIRRGGLFRLATIEKHHIALGLFTSFFNSIIVVDAATAIPAIPLLAASNACSWPCRPTRQEVETLASHGQD